MVKRVFECRPWPVPYTRGIVPVSSCYVLELILQWFLMMVVGGGREAGPGNVQDSSQRVDLGAFADGDGLVVGRGEEVSGDLGCGEVDHSSPVCDVWLKRIRALSEGEVDEVDGTGREEDVGVCRRDNTEGVFWGWPTGVVKPGRDPAHVAVTETLAETGVHCAVRSALGTRIHPITGALCAYYLCDHLAGRRTVTRWRTLRSPGRPSNISPTSFQPSMCIRRSSTR